MSPPADSRHEDQQPPVIIRDKRRAAALQPLPQGGDMKAEPAEPPPAAGAAAGGGSAPRAVPDERPDRSEADRSEGVETRARLAERTADLQRVKAEYDNYRKRVQRDRMAVREIAVANVLSGLLPVLDTITQAREHGEVTGDFDFVAEALETQLAALGLQSFGKQGEPFDPALHEALYHAHSDTVDRATCTAILRPGYRVGEHLLRPAQVAVTEPPGPGSAGAGNGET